MAGIAGIPLNGATFVGVEGGVVPLVTLPLNNLIFLLEIGLSPFGE
jgi:hypothetical protein